MTTVTPLRNQRSSSNSSRSVVVGRLLCVEVTAAGAAHTSVSVASVTSELCKASVALETQPVVVELFRAEQVPCAVETKTSLKVWGSCQALAKRNESKWLAAELSDGTVSMFGRARFLISLLLQNT